MENIYRHLTTNELPSESTYDCIRRASVEVGGPMFYSTLIFLVAFLPLFTMKGVEGAIFSPMSHTYAYALTIAIILAVMLSPVLSSFLLRKGMKETQNFIWEAFHNFYHHLFVRVLELPAPDAGNHHRHHDCGIVTFSASRRRVSAQAGRGQHLGARDHADYHFA